jgi:predicted nuclease of predicted toxin-antitoxin system
MRLLLDEMYPAAVAIALRDRGHDVIAVQEHQTLRQSSDEALFDAAQDLGRAIVTENMVDFLPLHARTLGAGTSHHGLILTTNRRFPRHRRRAIGALVAALDQFLRSPLARDEAASLVQWLSPPEPA